MGVSDAVYIACIVVMASAILAAFFLIVDLADVVRDDGHYIASSQGTTAKKGTTGILSVMTDPKIIILLPAMFVGEMCLALTSSVNASYFNLRTRTPNNLLFQAIMIPSPFLLAALLNNPRIPSHKARSCLVTLSATSGLLAWVLCNNITRSSTSTDHNNPVDWTSPAFIPGIILYLLFGTIYACFQITVQWTLAALTNDPALCARYAGAFKGTVSLGMCVSFTVDSRGMGFWNQVVMRLVLYAVGVGRFVRQTNYVIEEGVVVSDSSAVEVQGGRGEKGEGWGGRA